MSQYSHAYSNASDLSISQALMSIFNPVNSQRIISIDKIYISFIQLEVAVNLFFIYGSSISLATGGILFGQEDIKRLETYTTMPRAQVRDLPTTVVGLGDIIICQPPSLHSLVGANIPVLYTFDLENSKIVLQEGQGFVIRISSGGVGLTSYCITMMWDEKLGEVRYDKQSIQAG